MEHFRFTSHIDEILCLINQVSLWTRSPEEHLLWAGTELSYREVVTGFPQFGQPFEVCTLEIDKQLVGYLEVHHNHFGWVIARVLVHPDQRRRGLCQKMLTQVLTRIFTKSTSVSLFVDFTNTNARKIYQRFGFTQIESYPEDGVDRFLILKEQYFLTLIKQFIPKEERRGGSKLLSSLLTRLS